MSASMMIEASVRITAMAIVPIAIKKVINPRAPGTGDGNSSSPRQLTPATNRPRTRKAMPPKMRYWRSDPDFAISIAENDTPRPEPEANTQIVARMNDAKAQQ